MKKDYGSERKRVELRKVSRQPGLTVRTKCSSTAENELEAAAVICTDDRSLHCEWTAEATSASAVVSTAPQDDRTSDSRAMPSAVKADAVCTETTDASAVSCAARLDERTSDAVKDSAGEPAASDSEWFDGLLGNEPDETESAEWIDSLMEDAQAYRSAEVDGVESPFVEDIRDSCAEGVGYKPLPTLRWSTDRKPAEDITANEADPLLFSKEATASAVKRMYDRKRCEARSRRKRENDFNMVKYIFSVVVIDVVFMVLGWLLSEWLGSVELGTVIVLVVSMSMAVVLRVNAGKSVRYVWLMFFIAAGLWPSVCFYTDYIIGGFFWVSLILSIGYLITQLLCVLRAAKEYDERPRGRQILVSLALVALSCVISLSLSAYADIAAQVDNGIRGGDELRFVAVDIGGVRYAVYHNHAEAFGTLTSRFMDGEINIRETVFDKPVAGINQSAFANCNKVTRVNLPNTMRFIDRNAFAGNESMTDLLLPESLEEMRAGAFSGCESLRSVVILGNTIYIAEGVFSDCERLRTVTLCDQIREIGPRAFSGCSRMENIKLPTELRIIGAQAFADCDSLESISLPNNVLTVRWMAFADCNELREVRLPASLRELESDVFNGCDSLETIYCSTASPLYDQLLCGEYADMIVGY